MRTAVLLLALAGCQRWSRFAPPGGGFSVELPGQPAEVPSPLAQPGLTSRAWEAEGPGGARYQVGYLDLTPLPEEAFARLQAGWARDLARPPALPSSAQGSTRRVEAAGASWLEDQLSSPASGEPLRFVSRSTLWGRRRLWLAVTSPGPAPGQERFFASFAAR